MESSTMDQICGSKFWDSNLSWYTNEPDLTDCFKKTVLVWLPCAFLWTFCPLELYLIRHSVKRSASRDWLLFSKLGLILLTIVISMIDLGMTIYPSIYDKVHRVQYYTPCIKIFTFALAAILLGWNKKCGRRNSGVFFIFWFLLVACEAVNFGSTVKKVTAKVEPTFANISYTIYYLAILLICFLNFFAEGKPNQQSPAEKTSPLEYSSFPSNLFYTAFNALAWKGFRRTLGYDDLWSVNNEDAVNGTVRILDEHWQECWQHTESCQKREISLKKSDSNVRSSRGKSKKPTSILPVLWKSFRSTILAGGCMKLVHSVLLLVGPQLLRLLLRFVTGSAPLWQGYLYAALFLIVRSAGTFFLTHQVAYMTITGLRIRNAIIGVIYRKCLKITNSARKRVGVGEMINLMSVDVEAIMELMIILHYIWSLPLEIGLSLYFLHNILGFSAFTGIGVLLIFIPVHALMSNKLMSLNTEQMEKKDTRVELINEILNGMKVVKFYAWERSFEQQISKIRNDELNVLHKYSYYLTAISFVWGWLPTMVCFATLTTYVLCNDTHFLDAEKVFVSLTLFNLIQSPMTLFPEVVVQIIQTLVSLRRINTFLNAEELDPNNVQHDSSESHPLIIKRGTFSWSNDASVKPTLQNINFRVERYQLVAIVGCVGSGKSSLLSALLGEMDRISGGVNTKGTIAYVSQQAWIQNASVRDNILFGSPYDEELYNRVIEGCALGTDLKMFPAGDRTEIGEKGINLSGGQKQRMSLARAVYNGADVYLFDDPLSAVDAHVGKHIFNNVVGPNGMLKNKTRVLVTHGISYLPEVDNIFVLKDGEIVEHGTYNYLLDRKGAFSEFLRHYLQEVDRSSTMEAAADTDPVKCKLETTVDGESSETEFWESYTPTLQIHGTCELLRQEQFLENSGLAFAHRRHSELWHRSASLRRRGNPKDKTVSRREETGNCIEAENLETGVVKWKIYCRYLRAIGYFIVVSSFSMRLGHEACIIGANLWLSMWTRDNATLSNGVADSAERRMYLCVYGAFVGAQALLLLSSLFTITVGCMRSSRVLHEKLTFTVMRVPVRFFDVTPSARILHRFGKDMDVIDNVLPQTLKIWSFAVVAIAGTIVVISYTIPIFTAVIIPIGILYYFVQCVYLASSRQLMRLESISKTPIFSFSSESINGSSTIRAYRAQRRFIGECERRVDVNQACAYSAIIAERWLFVRLEFMGNIVVFFVVLFTVLQRDSLSAGLVGLSVTSALYITCFMQWMVKSASELESNLISIERIEQYNHVPREAPWEIAENTPAKEWPVEGRIEFRDYRLRYREGLDLALRGLTFSVRGGEKIGVVGRTGAGKSSLTVALFRIIESAGGQILIDDVDVSKIGLHSLRSKLTIIPQDPVVFSGTLRQNLDPFGLHTDDEVWTVLEHAYLKTFIEGLRGGLSHEISEGGGSLSLGQRQLLCLARALLRKTKILVMDEATASVDMETDDFIQRIIRKEFKDCTILTIAHRINTILDSDRVIVLDNGCISEFDSPENLLRKKTSQFYSMAKDAGLVA